VVYVWLTSQYSIVSHIILLYVQFLSSLLRIPFLVQLSIILSVMFLASFSIFPSNILLTNLSQYLYLPHSLSYSILIHLLKFQLNKSMV
jgi:hypothetical protein